MAAIGISGPGCRSGLPSQDVGHVEADWEAWVLLDDGICHQWMLRCINGPILDCPGTRLPMTIQFGEICFFDLTYVPEAFQGVPSPQLHFQRLHVKWYARMSRIMGASSISE